MSLADIRREYAQARLDEREVDPDPIVQFRSWFSDAESPFRAGKAYINRGISGQTTAQMLLRFRQDVINLRPAAVLILAGTNDIAGNTGASTLPDITRGPTSSACTSTGNGSRRSASIERKHGCPTTARRGAA